MVKRRRLAHQPRIFGVKREQGGGALHPDVKHGLESIAIEERKSMSWVVAEILSAFFGIDCVTGKKYRPKFQYADVPQQAPDANKRSTA